MQHGQDRMNISEINFYHQVLLHDRWHFHHDVLFSGIVICMIEDLEYWHPPTHIV